MSINPTGSNPSANSRTTATSEVLSPEFLSKLTDLAVPEFGVLSSSGLVDGQIAVLTSMKNQLEMIQVLALSGDEDQCVVLQANALHGFTSDLLRKVAIVELLVDELHSCRRANQ